MTTTNVSFLFTAKRTCTGDEQCDYFSEIIQLADASACPAQRPVDPWWILWTGNVQNTGPSSENGQATPRAGQGLVRAARAWAFIAGAAERAARRRPRSRPRPTAARSGS